MNTHRLYRTTDLLLKRSSKAPATKQNKPKVTKFIERANSRIKGVKPKVSCRSPPHKYRILPSNSR